MDDKLSTLHADLRLMQRARQFDKSMTELWDEGVECEVKHHSYDEARVVASEGIVLLKEDMQIVTILDNLHNVTVTGDELQAYLDEAINTESFI